ncbi:MAG: hemolysin family protein [Phycisphaerales bacterium JB063]
MNPAIWITLAACLLGCYFAACHTALKTYSRKRLYDLLDPRGLAGRAERVAQRLDQLLLMTGMLRVSLGVVIAMSVLYLVEEAGKITNTALMYGVAAAIASVLVSVFLVAIPVSWARYRRERLLGWSAPILHAVLIVCAPLAIALHAFDPIVRRISGADLRNDDDTDISDEVLSTIEDHEDADDIDESQKEMLEAVFELHDTNADEIMTPRTDVHGLDVEATLLDVKKAVHDFGHSRIPVYEESLDNIIGLLYVRDLVRFVGTDEDFHLRQIIREPFLVPESKPVRTLLAEFKQRKVHMAIVLDEYGGTAGLVTIEDILEEIVGEIQDEYDHEEQEPGIREIEAGVLEADGRVEIDDLEDALSLDFPEDRDYDTVGGFVFAELGHIPEAGESFVYEAFRVTVVEAERTRVVAVRIEQLEAAADPENAASNGR